MKNWILKTFFHDELEEAKDRVVVRLRAELDNLTSEEKQIAKQLRIAKMRHEIAEAEFGRIDAEKRIEAKKKEETAPIVPQNQEFDVKVAYPQTQF